MGNAFAKIWEYFQSKWYWVYVQPFAIAALAYVAVAGFAYQFIQAHYGLTLSWRLFLTSYVFRQITVAFVGVFALILIFMVRFRRSEAAAVGKVAKAFRKHRRIIVVRSALVCLVIAGVIFGAMHYAPKRVSHIRVRLMSPPTDFNRETLVYLLYELNAIQESWYFDFDFQTFNAEALAPDEASNCDVHPVPALCYAIHLSQGQPFIGITSRRLSDSVQFSRNNLANVSVITTADKYYEPLSVYEYLMYCVISQSIVIHLQTQSEMLPERLFSEQSTSHGGLFQFNPTPESIRATILTAHLSPEEQEQLFNRFGPQYISACSKLLTLEWLHSPRVSANLERIFKIKLPTHSNGAG